MRSLAVILLAAALCVPSLAQGPRTVIRSDFLLNIDTASYSGQHYPASAADRAGNFVVVWQDSRNGDVDIFARRYDSGGSPLGPSFRVNDDAAAYDQAEAHVAMNGAGQFVVAWKDPRDGLANIYAQRYGADGTALGPNFLVCEEDGYSSQWQPRVAVDEHGAFAVAWHDDRDGPWHIYVHRFDSTGASLSGDFRADDTPDYVIPYNPSTITINGSGGFVIAWTDYRIGNVNIRARLLDSAGVPVDTSFWVNTYKPGSQTSPALDMDHAGGFVIAWLDDRITSLEITAQRYDAQGAPLGSNFMVNDQSNTASGAPAIACDSAGYFTVAWDDNRGYDDGVYVQRYDANGTPQGANFQVSDYPGNENVSVPMGWTGNFHVIWEESWYFPIIKSQRFDSSGAAQGPIFQVDDHAGAAAQTSPSVAMGREGGFSVIWDHREDYGTYHLFMQRCGVGGDTVGGNVLVKPGIQSNSSAVAATLTGGILAAWVEGGRVKAQRFDSLGSAIGANVAVSDSLETSAKRRVAMDVDGTGGATLVWEDKRNDTCDIYLQRLDSVGAAVGPNTKANDDGVGGEQLCASAASSHAGGVFVVWQDKRDGDYNIYGQRYDPSGAAVGVNFRVNDDAGTRAQTMPAVACDSAGNAVVVWEDARGSISYHDIYAQRYDAAGAAVGANFRVEDDPGLSFQANPSVACSPAGERFVVCWTDYRNADGDPEIMAQSYLAGAAVGGNFLVTDQDSFPYHHQTTTRCNVSANDNLVAFAWTDNRRHKGHDVYARLMDWSFLSGLTGGPGPAAGTERLRAYPNPFRGSVAIDAPVKRFAVYDVSGRLISTGEGNSWDGRDGTGRKVASGVYVLKARGYLPAKVTVLR